MDDVRAIMDAISSQRAILIGFSEGCPMSVLFAATYPERVSHLILIGGYASAWTTDEAFEAFVAATVAGWGTGQLMKRVTGTHDGNEHEIALLGKLERLCCSPGYQNSLVDEPSDRHNVDPAQRAGSCARAAQSRRRN